MRSSFRVALASLALASATLVSGCVGCGGWDGEDNTMLSSSRGDAILVCGNGGFSAMLANGDLVEGWANDAYEPDGRHIYELTSGETGEHLYAITSNTDQTMSSPELGGTWTVRTMDQVERDHADVLCVDLGSRAWWTTAP